MPSPPDLREVQVDRRAGVHRALLISLPVALGLLLVALLAWPSKAPSQGDGALVPDLQSYPAEEIHITQDEGGDLADEDTGLRPDGSRLLLRFNGSVYNAGLGPVEMWHDGTRATFQRIYKAGGGIARDDTSRKPRIIFEPADGHNHWHFMNAARYSLWNGSKKAEVAPAQKVGFCLEDGVRVQDSANPDPTYPVGGRGGEMNFCKPGQPDASTVIQEGISPGWRDQYGWQLSLQWVDVSSVQPGSYFLNTKADPNNQVIETNENNPAAFSPAPVVISGYLGRPVKASTRASRKKTIKLKASTSGQPGARLFRIVSKPKHGTLSQKKGQAFQADSIRYKPRRGYRGADSFRYVAFDSTSRFPRNPGAATALVSVGSNDPSVGISGAPKELVAGTSVDLTAIVAHDAKKVKWSANHGKISRRGTFVAPSRTGKVKITARSRRARASVSIKVVPLGQKIATPATVAPRRGGAALASPALGRFQGNFVVTSSAAKAGTARVVLTKGGRTLGQCVMQSPAGQAFTCRVPGRGVASKGVTATVRYRDTDGELVDVKRNEFLRPQGGGHAAHMGIVCWLGTNDARR